MTERVARARGGGRLPVAAFMWLLVCGPVGAEGTRDPAEADSIPSRPWHDRLVAILSDYIVAQPPDSLQTELIPAEGPFREYQGRRIRRIFIEQLDMFSGMPRSAGYQPGTFFGRLARRTHRETRERVIREHLLVAEGDALDPFTLADTERILRATPFLQDAHIEVISVIGQSDEVDLLIVTRDVWSLGFSLPVDNVNELRFRVFERNLLGWGHQIDYRFWVETTTLKRTDWEATYVAGNIGGTFIRGELGLRDRRAERGRRLSFRRSPIAPVIRWAAAVTVEAIDRKDVEDEVPGHFRERYDRWDMWLGYNLPLGRNEAGGPGRVSLFPALRCIWTNFHQLPPGGEQYVSRYRDRALVLGGIQLGRNEFRKTRLLFAYGETEDVPIGYLFGLTAGGEFGDRMERTYVAAQAGGTGDTGGAGVVGGRLAIGAYRHGEVWEDGAVDAQAIWLSPLGRLSPFRVRQYARIWYTGAISRLLEREELVLDRETGLRGLRGLSLAGKQRLSCNIEAVTFTPWAILGFKIAGYGFADAGAVAPSLEELMRVRYYSSLGFGVRLRNERLVFDTVDLQFAFLPSPPEGGDLQGVRFTSITRLRAEVWEVGPPGLVEYR